MKKDKIKKYSIRFGIAFFIALTLLTYFSDTIDNMLLPKVKITEIIRQPNDNPNAKDSYLVPISAFVGFGEAGSIFIARIDENGNATVFEESVHIKQNDGVYYEVTSDSDTIYPESRVVYSTSKDIENGGRVYVEED